MSFPAPAAMSNASDVEKRVSRASVEDEESVDEEDKKVTSASEKKAAVSGKKAINARSDDFRLKQLDFEASEDAIYRKKWWQLW